MNCEFGENSVNSPFCGNRRFRIHEFSERILPFLGDSVNWCHCHRAMLSHLEPRVKGYPSVTSEGVGSDLRGRRAKGHAGIRGTPATASHDHSHAAPFVKAYPWVTLPYHMVDTALTITLLPRSQGAKKVVYTTPIRLDMRPPA